MVLRHAFAAKFLVRGQGLGVSLLFCLAIASILAPTPVSGQAQPSLNYEVVHSLTIDGYGFVQVNETVRISNPSSSPQTVPPFALDFPAQYRSHLASVAVRGQIDVSLSITATGNSTRLLLTPKGAVQVPGAGNATLSVGFYLLDLLKPSGPSQYNVTLALAPSSDLLLNTVKSTISLPPKANLVGTIEGFNKTSVVDIETWRATLDNVAPNQFKQATSKINVRDAVDFTLLEFPRALRHIVVSTSGTVTVRETVDLVNKGNDTLTKLRLTTLDDRLRSIFITPGGDPPLTPQFEAPLPDGILDLQATFRVGVGSGGRLSLSYEYQFPSKLLLVDGTSIRLEVPGTPPVPGVVDQLGIQLILPEGYLLLSSSSSSQVTNSSSFSDQGVTLAFSPGVAWAAGDIMPLASAVFVLALLAFVVSKVVVGEGAKKEAPKKISDFAKLYEEKLSASEEVFVGLRDKEVDRVARRELDEARRALEEIRSRALSRVGELRSQVLTLKPGLAGLLNEITGVEREYDRSVKDLFGVFEQYFTRRLRRETLQKLLPGYEKRYRKYTNSLGELLNTIHREFER